MGPYLPLLGLTVEHAYFGPAPCPSLRFVASERTQAWLARAACVVRDATGGFDLFCDAAERDRLALALNDADDPPCLSWWVHADDRLFSNYTDGLPRSPERVLAFDSASAVADETRDDWRLHAQPHAGTADAVAWPDERLGDIVPAPLRRVPPSFVVTLRLPADAAAAPARRYRLQFAARSPVWKYCLLGDWDHEQVRIVDLGQDADFTSAVNETLAGGRNAMAIRSRAGIALQERSARRFQLRGVDGSAERVLIKRLPVAGARHLACETIDGVATWVSEILVHR